MSWDLVYTLAVYIGTPLIVGGIVLANVRARLNLEPDPEPLEYAARAWGYTPEAWAALNDTQRAIRRNNVRYATRTPENTK